MEKMANKIADWIIQNNPSTQDKRVIFVYAIECLCGFIFSNGLVLLIASLLKLPLQAFIWLIFYNSLRFYIGGSHAKNFMLCLAGGTFFSVICILAVKYLVKIKFLIPIEIIFSILVTYIVAPVMHPNRSLSVTHIRKKHRVGKIIVIIQSVIICFGYNVVDIMFAHSAALGMFVAAFLCFWGRFAMGQKAC